MLRILLSFSRILYPRHEESVGVPMTLFADPPSPLFSSPSRALASVKATLGPAFSAGESAPAAGDVEMEVEAEAAVGLPAAATARVQDTSKACVLSFLHPQPPFLLSSGSASLGTSC